MNWLIGYEILIGLQGSQIVIVIQNKVKLFRDAILYSSVQSSFQDFSYKGIMLALSCDYVY